LKNKIKKIIFIIILIIIFILLCNFILEYINNSCEKNNNEIEQILPKFEPLSIDSSNNSKYQLNIISKYGDNEAYHPKVLSFKNEWNGYKYWMSYTPYPQGDDSKENPHIAVSNDMIEWETLDNLDTPKNTRPGKRYNSDSHLVYNSDLERLECYWRYVDDIKNKSIIYRRTTKDGINWSEKEIAILNNPRSKVDCLSPAIIYEDGQYKIWYIDKNNTMKFKTSKDGLNWSNETEIKMEYAENVKSWHLDVIHTEKGYEMLIVSFENWELRNDMNLYYTVSKDGINWAKAQVILRPTVGTDNWDNRGIYRSSFIYENGIYFVYYSGTNKDLHHGIGLVYGKDIFDLKQITIDYTKKEEVESLKSDFEKYYNSN